MDGYISRQYRRYFANAIEERGVNYFGKQTSLLSQASRVIRSTPPEPVREAMGALWLNIAIAMMMLCPEEECFVDEKDNCGNSPWGAGYEGGTKT